MSKEKTGKAGKNLSPPVLARYVPDGTGTTSKEEKNTCSYVPPGPTLSSPVRTPELSIMERTATTPRTPPATTTEPPNMTPENAADPAMDHEHYFSVKKVKDTVVGVAPAIASPITATVVTTPPFEPAEPHHKPTRGAPHEQKRRP